jgi:hypothetical protein
MIPFSYYAKRDVIKKRELICKLISIGPEKIERKNVNAKEIIFCLQRERK